MCLVSVSVRFATSACLWLGLLALNVSAQGIAGTPKIERPGSWITINEVDFAAAAPRDQISQGLYYLLSDTQIRIGSNTRETYIRLAMRVVNERGLAPAAQIEMRFDPSFQTLAIHAIDVVRDGKRIAKLKLGDVKLLRREKELDYQVLDGALSATFTLDDIRVGDVVDFSYTISGHNPVFDGQHSGRFDLQWSAPVKRVYAALEIPLARKIHLLEKNGAPKPRIVESSSTQRYEWIVKDISALSMEPDTPGWYDPYARVEWSEFADWNAVSVWGRRLYSTKAHASSVHAIAEKLAAEHKTNEERTIAALRFVQTEIRYLSVAIGQGSYAPSAPDVVLRRRFGDCKDKSLLLIAILERLGVRATPALVNTAYQRGARESLPSPLAFNHVLVRVELPSKSLWMDPTQSLQGGTLDTIMQPDFGVALLLSDKVESLTPMEASGSNARRSLRLIDATLDLRQGYESPARYSISTTHEGIAADNMRANFRAASRDDLQKTYRNFYDAYFSGIKAIGGIAYADDLNANRIVVTETYEIPVFWQLSDAKKRREGVVYAPDIEALLRAPRSAERTLPLIQSFPLEMRQTTQVLLSEKFVIADEVQKISDTAFEFERRIERVRDNEFLLRDSFATKADEIAPAALSAYAANLAKARVVADFVLKRSGEGHDGGSTLIERVNWLIVALALCLLSGWAWLAYKVYRYDPPPQPGEASGLLSGINGWLVVLAIGMCVAPLRLMYGMWENAPSYSVDTWLSLTSRTGDAYNPLWAPLLIAELAGNLGLLVFALLLALLFFQRRTSFPNVYIAYSVCGLIFLALDLVMMHFIPSFEEKVLRETIVDVVRGAIVALIWSIYLKRSVRARSTFIERRSRERQSTDSDSPGAAVLQE